MVDRILEAVFVTALGGGTLALIIVCAIATLF